MLYCLYTKQVLIKTFSFKRRYEGQTALTEASCECHVPTTFSDRAVPLSIFTFHLLSFYLFPFPTFIVPS